jgi:hypothetical protein
MQQTKSSNILVRTSGALLAFASAALAHHVHVPLSTLFGPEVLDGVVFYTETGKFGVPHVRPSTETFDHDHTFAFADGDSFDVTTNSGATETVVFDAASFQAVGSDIGAATAEEVAEVLSAQATLLEAYTANEALVVRGLEGGSSKTLDLTDGTGSPLAKLTLPSGAGAGSDHLDLVISIPEDHPVDLAGHNYWLLISGTPGSLSFQGQTIPLGVDATLNLGAVMAASGKLPGFIGQLDAGNDAAATAVGAWFTNFTPGMKLYFAYVVMSPDWSTLDYVSNRFTVDFL